MRVLIVVASLDLRVLDVSCETRGSDVIVRFDVGVMSTHMLDEKVNGCSQCFLNLRNVAVAQGGKGKKCFAAHCVTQTTFRSLLEGFFWCLA